LSGEREERKKKVPLKKIKIKEGPPTPVASVPCQFKIICRTTRYKENEVGKNLKPLVGEFFNVQLTQSDLLSRFGFLEHCASLSGEELGFDFTPGEQAQSCCKVRRKGRREVTRKLQAKWEGIELLLRWQGWRTQ
jgi:hypothetical protein